MPTMHRSVEIPFEDGVRGTSQPRGRRLNVIEDPELKHAIDVVSQHNIFIYAVWDHENTDHWCQVVKLTSSVVEARDGMLRATFTVHDNGDFEFMVMYTAQDEQPQTPRTGTKRKRRTPPIDEDRNVKENTVRKPRQTPHRDAKPQSFVKDFRPPGLDDDEAEENRALLHDVSSENIGEATSNVAQDRLESAHALSAIMPPPPTRGSYRRSRTISSPRAKATAVSRKHAKDQGICSSSEDSSSPPRAAPIKFNKTSYQEDIGASPIDQGSSHMPDYSHDDAHLQRNPQDHGHKTNTSTTAVYTRNQDSHGPAPVAVMSLSNILIDEGALARQQNLNENHPVIIATDTSPSGDSQIVDSPVASCAFGEQALPPPQYRTTKDGMTIDTHNRRAGTEVSGLDDTYPTPISPNRSRKTAVASDSGAGLGGLLPPDYYDEDEWDNR